MRFRSLADFSTQIVLRTTSHNPDVIRNLGDIYLTAHEKGEEMFKSGGCVGSPMFPGMNPRDVQKAMKRLGIKQEEISASEVVIKCGEKDLVIRNPQVTRVNMMGQETFQVVGEVEEVSASLFSEEDVKEVVAQTGVSEKKAREVLEANKGDLAKSILDLQS